MIGWRALFAAGCGLTVLAGCGTASDAPSAVSVRQGSSTTATSTTTPPTTVAGATSSAAPGSAATECRIELRTLETAVDAFHAVTDRYPVDIQAMVDQGLLNEDNVYLAAEYTIDQTTGAVTQGPCPSG